MWKKIYFNKQNIKYETAKAVLIKMPNSSNYKDYYFWHPAKLVREEGGKGYFYSFSYTEDFDFKVAKYNSKNQITVEKLLDYEDMENAFESSNRKSNEKITTRTVKPEKIENTEVQIDEDLKI